MKKTFQLVFSVTAVGIYMSTIIVQSNYAMSYFPPKLIKFSELMQQTLYSLHTYSVKSIFLGMWTLKLDSKEMASKWHTKE